MNGYCIEVSDTNGRYYYYWEDNLFSRHNGHALVFPDRSSAVAAAMVILLSQALPKELRDVRVVRWFNTRFEGW